MGQFKRKWRFEIYKQVGKSAVIAAALLIAFFFIGNSCGFESSRELVSILGFACAVFGMQSRQYATQGVFQYKKDSMDLIESLDKLSNAFKKLHQSPSNAFIMVAEDKRDYIRYIDQELFLIKHSPMVLLASLGSGILSSGNAKGLWIFVFSGFVSILSVVFLSQASWSSQEMLIHMEDNDQNHKLIDEMLKDLENSQNDDEIASDTDQIDET